MRKLAVGSWAYIFGPYEKEPIDFDTVIKTISEMGFDAVSIAGFRPHIMVDDYKTEEKQKELVEMLKSYNIEVAEYSPDPCGINPIVTPEPYIERMKQNILLLEACNFKMLRLDTGTAPILPEGISYELAYERTVYVFRELTLFAKEHGVKIVWEFEPGFMFNKPSEVVSILNDVNDDNFTILFDTCHAYMCSVIGARQIGEKETLKGGVEEFLDMLKGHIGMVHLIDSDGTLHDDDTSTHSPFGDGNIDMDSVYKKLMDPEIYNGEFISIDLCFWAKAWDVTKRCYDYVRELQRKYEQ